MSLRRRAVALAALHARIRVCRACEAAGFLDEARPLRESCPVDSPVLLVGQAPGARSDRSRRHFEGTAGAMLEHWFERAGFPRGYLRQRVYLTALTRCYPGKSVSGKGDRVPSPAELALCRPFLDDELALVAPRLIVLVGRLAIEAFLGRCRLADVVGTLQWRDGRALLPLPHTSGVSRWLNEPANRKRVEGAIALLAECRVSLRLAEPAGGAAEAGPARRGG